MKKFIKKIIRYCRFYFTNGPNRIKVARLRRSGCTGLALERAFGLQAHAILIITLIKRYPYDLNAREIIKRSILRQYSANIKL